jgi:hypothetical protein
MDFRFFFEQANVKDLAPFLDAEKWKRKLFF